MRIDKYISKSSRTDSRQRASKGEVVFNALMPNRSYWGTWGWNNRLEQVQHLTNWVYVACDTICSLFGQHMPNLAYVEDTDEEQAGRGQRRKSVADRRGNYIYDFRQQLSQPKGNGGLVLGKGSKGWDGAALASRQRHAVSQYPGYATYKAISSAQPHEQLEPLSSRHPLRRLLVNPNRYDTSYDLEYELCLYLLLCGVSYLWAVPDGYGTPCELWVIPAHWVWPRGSTGQTVDPAYQHLIDHYEVRPFGAAGGGYGMVSIPADEVIAFTLRSPLSKIDGWSKLTAVSQWIDTSESMDRSAWAQMQNQGMPSMFIELGEAYADADDNQTARIEAKFAQKLGGEYNVGRPFVGKPGMKMTPLNWSPESMMYPTMGDSYRDKVLAAFHLSKVAIGMMDDMTYGSILAALAHTWIHCLNPLAGMIGQRFTKELAPRFASPEYRKMLKEAHFLDDQGDNVLFSGRSKAGYVREDSGKRRVLTGREEEEGRQVRVWWPDGSPPDPQQVNADIQLDFTTASITTNEIRAIRGRPPYDLGGDNPLVQGPGGLMPLPLNVEEDIEGLGELVGAFTAAASGQAEEEQEQGAEDGDVAGGVPGVDGGVLDGGAGGEGDPEAEPTLEELSGEEPEGLSPSVEEPNGAPRKSHAVGGKPSKHLNGTNGRLRKQLADTDKAPVNQYLRTSAMEALRRFGYSDRFVQLLVNGSDLDDAALAERLEASGANPRLSRHVVVEFRRLAERGLAGAQKTASVPRQATAKALVSSPQRSPVAAGLAVVAQDTGRVLLLQRQLDGEDPNSGKWEFPGGKIDQGEAPLEAAAREWVEEVGHALPQGRLDGEWGSGNGKYVGFVYQVPDEASVQLNCRKVDADPESGGWAAVAWVDPEDLAQHNLRPALLGDIDEVLENMGTPALNGSEVVS